MRRCSTRHFSEQYVLLQVLTSCACLTQKQCDLQAAMLKSKSTSVLASLALELSVCTENSRN
jgi:hypothetical protein